MPREPQAAQYPAAPQYWAAGYPPAPAPAPTGVIEGLSPANSQPPRPPRRPVLWIGAATGLVIVLVVAAVLFRLHGGESASTSAAKLPTSTTKPQTTDTVPTVTTQLGVFVGTNPKAVSEFGNWLGRDPSYVVDFSARQTWSDIADPQEVIDAWKGKPYRTVYSVALLPEDTAATIKRGADGEYDKYFKDLAKNLVDAGQEDSILRLGWEFNLEDSRWSTDDTASFISYWRHVVTAMRSQPGQKFEFDWNLSNGDSKYDASKYYPGDDFVDYVGVDAYDDSWADGSYPYPDNCDSTCRSQRQKVAWDESIYGGSRGLRYWASFATSHGKPMTLPEWGLWDRDDAHGGGEDLNYLTRMSSFIADPANNVAYQAYFEFDGSDGPHRLMTTFPKAGELFRTLFAKT